MDSAIVWLDELDLGRITAVAGPELARLAAHIPHGFVVVPAAFGRYCADTGLAPLIDSVLAGLPDAPTDDQLDAATGDIRSAFDAATIPARLAEQIAAGYRELCTRCAAEFADGLPVAVRGSVTGSAEDAAELVGTFDVHFGRCGAEDVLDAVKQCWSSLFNPDALGYRAQEDIDYRETPMAVGVLGLSTADASA